MLVWSSITRDRGCPQPEASRLAKALLKSSGVSSSSAESSPMLIPPGTAAFAFRPFQTPPACLSIKLATGDAERQLDADLLVHVSRRRSRASARSSWAFPIDLNQSAPRSTMWGTQQRVSTLLTTVGLRNAPSIAGNGGLIRGQPRFPRGSRSVRSLRRRYRRLRRGGRTPDVEVEARAIDVLAEVPGRPRPRRSPPP